MKIDVIPYPNGDTFITLEEHRFVYNGSMHVIPAGYRSDGASVPRFFWRILSPKIDPHTLDPSVEHDYIYEHAIGSRCVADKYYLVRLIEYGYPVWKSILTFYAVRFFGGTHYGK